MEEDLADIRPGIVDVDVDGFEGPSEPEQCGCIRAVDYAFIGMLTRERITAVLSGCTALFMYS